MFTRFKTTIYKGANDLLFLGTYIISKLICYSGQIKWDNKWTSLPISKSSGSDSCYPATFVLFLIRTCFGFGGANN